MSEEMKMSDVFNDGCNAFNSYLVDDYEDPDNLKVIANFDMDYVQIVSEKMAYYAAHAINNHDRLTQENQQLREALKESQNIMNTLCLIVFTSEYTNSEKLRRINRMIDVHMNDIYTSNKQLLSKLEAKQ